jgi:AAA family ATP:ADP antiporter
VIGGWVGSVLAKVLLGIVHGHGLLVMAALLMGGVAALISPIEGFVRSSGTFRPAVGSDSVRRSRRPSGDETLEGARLVFRSWYLVAIVGIMGLYEVASQLMDYQFKLASQGFGSVEQTQAFMANVYFYANLLSVFVQFFLVSFIMRNYGLTTSLLVLPVSLIAGAIGFAAAPSLLTVSLMVILDNGLNYSLQQTARESLFTPTSRDEKYKARAFINMFVQRVAKGLSIFLALGFAALGFGLRSLSVATLATLVTLALCGLYAGRRYAGRVRAGEQDQYAA